MGGGQVKIEGGITYFGDVRLATPFFEGSQGGGEHENVKGYSTSNMCTKFIAQLHNGGKDVDGPM